MISSSKLLSLSHVNFDVFKNACTSLNGFIQFLRRLVFCSYRKNEIQMFDVLFVLNKMTPIALGKSVMFNINIPLKNTTATAMILTTTTTTNMAIQ